MGNLEQSPVNAALDSARMNLIQEFGEQNGLTVFPSESPRANLEKQFNENQLYQFHSQLIERYMSYLQHTREIRKSLGGMKTFGGLVLTRRTIDSSGWKYERVIDRTGRKSFALNREREAYDIDFVPFGEYEPVNDRRTIVETMLLGSLDARKMISYLSRQQKKKSSPGEILAFGKAPMKQISEAIGLYCSNPQFFYRTLMQKGRIIEAKMLKIFDKGKRLNDVQWYYIFSDNITEFLEEAPNKVISLQTKAKKLAKKMGITEKDARIDAISYLLENDDLMNYIKESK